MIDNCIFMILYYNNIIIGDIERTRNRYSKYNDDSEISAVIQLACPVIAATRSRWFRPEL